MAGTERNANGDASRGEADGPGSADVPIWDDEYADRVSDRLMHNYDLEKDVTVEGYTFDLYGEMEIHNQKHMFHPAISFAHHELREYLFARRSGRVRIDDLEALVRLGHTLADEWIVANEDHYSTDFTFVSIADAISDDVRAFVESFSDRTLLKFGYNGHYEINLVVVDPAGEDIAASPEADVKQAFTLWEPIEPSEPGLLGLIARRFQL